jgi:hypothetical protein
MHSIKVYALHAGVSDDHASDRCNKQGIKEKNAPIDDFFLTHIYPWVETRG